MNTKSRPSVRVRRVREEDLQAVYECQAAAYAHLPAADLCDLRLLRMQLSTFPDGQLVAVAGDQVVGYASSLIVHLDEDSPWYSYAEITGNGTFSSHYSSGDTLYGADIAVHPDWRGRNVAALLYAGRKRIMRRFNLRRMVAGGRIPGYVRYAGKMTAEDYVAKVQAGELQDQALNAHLKAGYAVRGVHMGYLNDDQSLDYATFLELENPDHRPEKRRIAAAPLRRPVRKIRVCAAQYQMRRITSWEDFERQVDFFVETAEGYHCHFLLYPELFTAQLFSSFPDTLPTLDAIEALADLHPRYLELFTSRAKRANLHIIAGSHPTRVDGKIRNVAHLFTPSGNVYTQDKLHVTPNEREVYGIEPGSGVKVFDTGYARIAIQVCYDIEFPEIARLLTLAGAEVMFVPFSTDERKAYLRVKYTAQARAVENAVYVVTAGNVGNLPQVTNFLINYGQAAVYTPSDFAFPTEAVAATADSTSETVVITDLDLGDLETAREAGSVRHLRDRRLDLYTVVGTPGVEVVRTV